MFLRVVITVLMCSLCDFLHTALTEVFARVSGNIKSCVDQMDKVLSLELSYIATRACDVLHLLRVCAFGCNCSAPATKSS